ncbi:MAG TPA: tetratricopeptide repeat protein [Myxococcota bacterium]|nr:tetratricopeptide repeat protein [Myxococcota bacterium]
MSTRRLAWLALALCACSPSADRAREQAQQALARGERDAAIRAIEALHAAAPTTPDAYLEQAVLWIRAGEAPRAVWLLEEGAARFPERSDVRLFLASTALLVGDPARAEAVAGAIPEEADEYPEALLLRAQARIALGDLDGGLAAFREAEAERPGRATSWIPRIAALLQEARFAEARAALDEAQAAVEEASERDLLRRAELALYQYQAAEALRRAGDPAHAGDAAVQARARQEVEAALIGVRALAERTPDDTAAWQLLASLAIAGGRPELAEPALGAALDADPERLALYSLLASLAIARGDEAEAERQLRALAQRADTPAASASLADYLSSRERNDEAMALLDAAIARHGDDEVLLFARAELLLKTGRLDDAEPAIARAEARASSAPTAELLRARLALARGDAALARVQLERLAPRLDTAATQYWLGRALEQSGDLAGAAHRYRISAARDPSAPGPWLELLRLAQERGDAREAGQAAAGALTRAPQLIAGWQGLVDALIEQGVQGAALDTAQRAQALQPDRWETAVLLARAQRASGRKEDALAQLDAAATRFGERPEIAAERVLVLGLAGRLDEARAEAQRAIAAHGDGALYHHALAGVLFQAGQADLGAAEVERALALAPDDLRPLALRCQFRAATARFDLAARDCARFLETHPDHATLWFVLGVAQAGAGHRADAEASYRRAAALDPRAVAPRNNLALLLSSRGDLDGALAAAQEAFAQAEESPEVLDTLGWLYLQKGLVARAVSLLEDAHRRAPALDAAALHLALAYRKAGREDAARPLLEALGKRGAASPELRAQLDAALRR